MLFLFCRAAKQKDPREIKVALWQLLQLQQRQAFPERGHKLQADRPALGKP